MSAHDPAQAWRLAAELLAQGQALAALELLERAVDDFPAHVALCRYAGEVALHAHAPQRALIYLQRAEDREPGDLAGRINLSLALIQVGSPERAIAILSPLMATPPNRQLSLNYARALQDCHRLEEAADTLRRLLAAASDDVEALTNLGTVLRDDRQIAPAITCFERALALAPGLQAARDNLAHTLLSVGDYRRGFAAFEGRRFEDATGISAKVPRWDGRPLPGLRLHVIAEQGFGDMLMFARFGRELTQRGIETVLHVHPRLVRLLGRSRLFSEVVPYGRAPLGATARWAPLMSLAHLLGVTLENLPAPIPYLVADRPRIERWSTWLGPKTGPRIGIAWAGNPRSEQDDLRGRSVPLAAFASLLSIEGAQLISLQREYGLEQFGEPTWAGRLRCPDPPFDAGSDGFLDTAALICSLDLVITCDTSIAHLAGGLGHPTWVALHHTPDWRWLRVREDSPWYPTLRLVRQTQPGNWADVFSALPQRVLGRP